MKKRYPILLLMTFAAAAWCVGQVARPTGTPGVDSLANLPPASTQPDPAGAAAKLAAPLTDQQRDAVLAFLKTEEPELSKKLEDIKASSPSSYSAMLGVIEQKVRPLMMLKESDPQLYGFYKDDMRISQAIDRLRITLAANRDPAKLSELERQLREQLVARFDLVQQRQKVLISHFKARMEHMNSMLETREANRNKIIEDQLKQILDQARHSPATIPAASTSIAPVIDGVATPALSSPIPAPASQPG